LTTALIIGASGLVGSLLVRELDNDPGDITVRLSTSRPEQADKWRAEGREATVLDLNNPATFPEALADIDQVFLLTGYTADMLFQSKMFTDAAVDAGVKHMVHLGVYSSGRDAVPHYSWHELIETYIQASGMAWTHLHPNVITESVITPDAVEAGSFTVAWGEAPVGWSGAADIAAVAAAVLRQGPAVHGGKNYWLSTEVATGIQAAASLSDALGKTITCTPQGTAGLEAYAQSIDDAGTRLYMQSAVQKMQRSSEGALPFEATVRDDVQSVLGRPGMTLTQWAKHAFTTKS
jgi:NAD(P)H dehydrogenase (quinone)